MEAVKQSERPVILVVCDYYLPGFESGGAMRTIVNMVERLSDEFEFRIITRDHDGPLNRTPYASVQINAWNDLGGTSVYYVAADRVAPATLAALIGEVRPAAVYLNSFFSPLTVYTLMLKRRRRIGSVPLIIAPEGEFSPGALALKRTKKRFYLRAARSLLPLRQVVWKAAADSERDDIHAALGDGLDIMIAPNMPPAMILPAFAAEQKPPKTAGEARAVFLSRYMRKKNFNWLLGHLGAARGDLLIDIYGPVEEADYHADALRLIQALPSNVKVSFKGPVAHEQAAEVLTGYHFFVLPTLGENFGHVFVEALAAGCPLLISDRTPWRELETKGVGWDLSLDSPDGWIERLDRCIAMSGDEYRDASARARAFAVSWLRDPAVETANREVLRYALGTMQVAGGPNTR